MINYYSQDYLAHYGIKGMKWGVRRYQNKDGSLTPAGQKRLANMITSRKTSAIDAQYNARNFARTNKNIQDYKTNQSYQVSKKKMDAYLKAKDKYLRNYEKARRDIFPQIEKKYGKYQDLEYKQDYKSMKKFNDAYDKEMTKRGVYGEEKRLRKKFTEAENARYNVDKETRMFVSNFIGKYGDKKLKGQGSTIYRGGKVVDRLKVSDVLTKAIMDDDFYKINYSRDRN